VLVPVTLVSSVTMPIVDVVDMIAMLKRFVAASWAVNVLVGFVDDVAVERALIPVGAVGPVGMTVVKVVSMVPMLDRNVTASGAVVVRMIFVRSVFSFHVSYPTPSD
jgi:hypothetical protein